MDIEILSHNFIHRILYGLRLPILHARILLIMNLIDERLQEKKYTKLRHYSFILVISIAPLQVLYYSEHSRLQHRYCVGVLRRSAQATLGKGLAQGPYVAASAGVEPTTLCLKVIDSTNAPPRPTVPYNYRGCGKRRAVGHDKMVISMLN